MREENGGGDVGYYGLEIKHPKRFEPCMVECEDVIRALGLNFFEGEAFKAIWRKGAQRTLGLGKAGNTALRDAQKMAHYGARELAHEQQLAAALRPAPALAPFDPVPPNQWLPGDYVQGKSGITYIFDGADERGDAQIRNSGSLPFKNLTWVSRPEAEPAPLPWISYTTGPAPDLDWVEVMTACGEPKVGAPSDFIWGGHGTKGRITHYREAIK